MMTVGAESQADCSMREVRRQ